MRCQKCTGAAELKEFTTFKYWYCGSCKCEVTPRVGPVQAGWVADIISKETGEIVQSGTVGSGDYFSQHNNHAPIGAPPTPVGSEDPIGFDGQPFPGSLVSPRGFPPWMSTPIDPKTGQLQDPYKAIAASLPDGTIPIDASSGQQSISLPGGRTVHVTGDDLLPGEQKIISLGGPYNPPIGYYVKKTKTDLGSGITEITIAPSTAPKAPHPSDALIRGMPAWRF